MGTVINEPMSSSINHQDALRLLNLKVGDTVLVTAKAKDRTRGWNNTWTLEMSECVGKEFKVLKIDSQTGVRLNIHTDRFNPAFPAFVLAKVDSQQKAKTASSSSLAAAVDELESKLQSLKESKSTSSTATYGPNAYLLLG